VLKSELARTHELDGVHLSGQLARVIWTDEALTMLASGDRQSVQGPLQDESAVRVTSARFAISNARSSPCQGGCPGLRWGSCPFTHSSNRRCRDRTATVLRLAAAERPGGGGTGEAPDVHHFFRMWLSRMALVALKQSNLYPND
jgi:hypothetical protein